MPRLKTSSARTRALVAAPVLALLIAGCGTTSSSSKTTGVTATGSTLTVYLSDPAAVRANPSLQDVVDAERLAWDEESTSVTKASIKLVVGTDTVSDNARAAIARDSLIAYLGEVQTGQSAQTVGITNDEDVLELSPTDTVVPNKNDFEDFATYGRTYASLPVDLTTSASALSQALPTFAKAFKASYGHSPSANAIEGYDAVWVLLRVLSYLGSSANNRSKVALDVIATLKGNKGQASVPAFSIKK